MRINFKAATFAIFAIFIVSQSMPFSALAQSLEEFSAHVDRAIQLNNEGKYSEAIAEAEKALAVAEQHLGPDHEGTLTVVDMLGFLYSKNTQFREADRFYTRVLEARRRLSKDHPDTLTTLKLICGRHIVDARWSEAEPICREAFDGRRRVLGDEHTDTLSIENELGLALHNLGRYAEAGRHLKHSAETLERSKGIDDRLRQSALGNLAGHYNDIGLHGDAERILIRVLEAREDLHGKGHFETLTTANTLAVVYSAQGRYQEAVALLETVWETRKRVLGLEHFDTLSAANNLAANYSDLERYEDAETLYKSVLEISERLRHPDHPDIINGLNNLGVLYDEMGRDQEAEPLLRRAAEAAERTLGNHPLTSTVLGNLAALYFEARDWKRASDLWRRCTAILAVMTRRNATAANQAPTGKIVSEAEGAYRQFLGLVKAIYRDKPDEASARETFESVQWALGSEAARSLVQMAARGAKDDPALAARVRERQDLLSEWQAIDAARTAALGQAPSERDRQAEPKHAARMTEIERRVAEIDERLKAEFPDYFALASPEPMPVGEVQARLAEYEALLLFLDTPESPSTPEETFIWVVTRSEIRWLRSDVGRRGLVREVRALRCGLDYTAWRTPGCEELTGRKYHSGSYQFGVLPPFDAARSHRLYKSLLGDAEELLKDKGHLIFVPAGALMQLPPQVLVTDPPAEQKAPAWLIRDHAVSVLPAISSLKALRGANRPSVAPKPMIGFGNPLFDGNDPERARQAREKQSCPKTVGERMASLFGFGRGVTPIPMRGLADPEAVRAADPLPETADELCAVARQIGADVDEIRLGARATEKQVKALSDNGPLAQYRFVHFATHGAMAGELRPGYEPGLLLTPPDKASETDDGYLTASEIAGLKLNADWVILSACNTAAGQAENAEALSGLARAFFYAQARALLVSHWEVASDATVTLITTAMKAMTRDERVGRAEALRHAMLSLIDSDNAVQAHPSIWAPFVVVGEGAHYGE